MQAQAAGGLSGSLLWGTEAFNGNNSIYLKAIDTQELVSTISVNSDGSFNTGLNIPAGTYTANPYIRSRDSGAGSFELSSQTVNITDGQSSVVNFDIQAETGLVKGSILVNGQSAGGDIQFCDPGGPCSFRTSDGPLFGVNGNFSVPLLPGSYILHARYGGFDLGSIPVTVIAGQIFSNTSTQFSINLGGLSGSLSWGSETIHDGNGYIWLRDATTQELVSTIFVNSDGTFSTGFNLPTGNYTATAVIYDEPYKYSFELVNQQNVVINTGQTTTGVNFDAQPETGLVKGNTIINGQPANVDMQFCAQGGPCTIFNLNDGFSYGVSGNFSLALLPGNYVLHARNTVGFDLGSVPIVVTAGQTIDLSTFSATISPGSNVTASIGNVDINFATVSTSGFVTVTTTSTPQGGIPPQSFRFLGTYYEINTTADYTGPVTLSIAYNPSDVHGQESNLKLFHWDGTTWVNIATSVDTVNHIITGVSPTLSPFAIGEPLNASPSVDAGGPYSVNEGGSVEVTGTGNDPENGSLTYAWDLDNNGSFETPGQSVSFSASSLDGPSGHTIAVQVTDDGNLTATNQATVNILNVVPTVGAITATTDPVQVNTQITASTSFTDPGTPDTHTAVWDWGDGNTTTGTVTESNGSGSVSNSHTYAAAGVYTVKLTVTDDDNDSGESIFQYVVVYDPSAGYVTGAGTITSPLGAYTLNPLLTGKAIFGFVSRYQNGANVPTGSTQFRFVTAQFTFNSTSYDWLVVGGPRAQYKGSGTINGSGDYGFILTSIDGQVNGGGGTDKFRIKIYDKTTSAVIYDNQIGASDTSDPTTVIDSGSNMIHH